MFIAWGFLGFILLGLVLLWDALNYHETLGWFWCKVGKHQFHEIHGAVTKDFYEPTDYCRLCKTSKIKVLRVFYKRKND
jgi:hypothetical protein